MTDLNLNSSLTAMDWLPRLNAQGALGAAGIGPSTAATWLDMASGESTECVTADSSTPPSPSIDSKPPYR